MTATGRDYREALTRMSNGDLLRAYGQAVLDNDGPGSRGFFQQQSIASELLKRMEPYDRTSHRIAARTNRLPNGVEQLGEHHE